MATAKEKLIASAQKLVEKGSFEKAIKEYLRVVQEDDSDVRIWLKIGDLYAKIGKKTEATDTYQRVAQFYSNQGFYLKSVAVYKQILKLEPRLVDVNQRLAELYKQLGLISDAIGQYEQVAGFFHKEGKVADAIAAMKQIVELDPETVAARIKLAELYSRENMPREAIDEFTRAAEQLKEGGRLDEYMKVAERLLFHAPENKAVTKELARLYIEKNDPRRALPKIQVLFKNDPRDFDVLRLLARAFEGLEQRPKAVSVYKELARILNETGDARGATDVFRQILTIQPDDADAVSAVKGAPPAALPNNRKPTIPPQSSAPTAMPPSSSGSIRTSSGALDSGGHRALPNTAARSAAGGRDVPAPDAPASALAEEVAKLLSETDVYIKYNLHAKAIEHLQRVFERQPRHVAGREKLKALYITTGRRDDAITELWALADSAEPGRARRYVREIYELDPSNARAAKTLGEPVRAPGSHVPEAAPEPEDDFGVAIESGVGLDFGLPSTRRESQGAPNAPAPDELDFNDFSEVSGVAIDDSMIADDDSAIGLADLEEDASAVEIGEDLLDAPLDLGATLPSLDDDLIPVVVDTGADMTSTAPAIDEDSDRFSLSTDDEPAASNSFDAANDEHTSFSAPAMAHVEESFVDVPDDHTGLMSADELRGLEAPPRPRFAPAATAVSPPLVDEMDFSSVSNEVPEQPAEEPEPEQMPPPPVAVEPSSGSQRRYAPAPVPDPLRQESSLEDDLDESDFFMQQSLFDEARMMLTSLLERYPNHPLVLAKLRDLEGMDPGVGADVSPIQATNTAELALPPDSGAHEALLEEPPISVSEPISAEVPRLPAEPVEVTRRGVVERGVSAEDFDTRFDLGIAYKEMGLIDQAVEEFRIVMNDPAREVQCLLMIGTCLLEKQQFTEAINQFKKGLYVEGITDGEALSLYYELGAAYEKIGDPREALYYYDKVQKRDPKFRDLARRLAALRGEEPEAEAPPRGDDVDGAFDSLLDES